MTDSSMQTVAISSICAIVGVVFGVVLTGWQQRVTDRTATKLEAALAVVYSPEDPESEAVEVLVNSVRQLMLFSPDVIESMAALSREHPECWRMKEPVPECFPVIVHAVQFMREEIDAGSVPDDDIATLLAPAYERYIDYRKE